MRCTALSAQKFYIKSWLINIYASIRPTTCCKCWAPVYSTYKCYPSENFGSNPRCWNIHSQGVRYQDFDRINRELKTTVFRAWVAGYTSSIEPWFSSVNSMKRSGEGEGWPKPWLSHGSRLSGHKTYPNITLSIWLCLNCPDLFNHYKVNLLYSWNSIINRYLPGLVLSSHANRPVIQPPLTSFDNM